ncbi:MAG: histidine--tRNA ligase [Candidatus Nanopelagicales bacterium]|jgi:histidyl-tRNA synthetase|uniref:Histidine--tRNA ligase n=2 Tax=ac1 cluster TaxID=1655545 RepID=A0A0R2NYX0_9ACTN|nr:MAG: histidine--tRNA ligase [Actinobacteria bacterium BACL2 MAG-120802-bin41]MDP4615686.1 histidine--tRNA ligase [Candidatus Nanopelagicales bacterium]MDP4653449.1 histidine--tRNA ligase [Candidatus Nanopelagicales bacterium]MDP4931414.1 histidine--tRNA ligase [Candidatus Nanopelagicaceae bacterium]
MSSKFAAPKGVSEYLPPRSNIFDHIVQTLKIPALAAGYELIELPIFEDTELFTRGVGASTDVVTKEMYTFEDRGGRSLTLRPEGTAGVIRAVIEHGLDRASLPVKLFYHGPFFRAERPQAGRYRQFYQFGIEAIGSDDPYLDAEVISIAYQGYRKLGLKNFELQITSLGDSDSRVSHRKDLDEFIAGLNLDEETRNRALKNPLRLFDDKRDEIKDAMSKAPLLLDYLNAESRENFEQVKSALDSLGIAYQVNPRMVRGLDYYTGTTFEFVHSGLGAQSGIGGGGRYDGLMELLGGSKLSGIGFGLGIDRILLALEAEAETGQLLPGELKYIDLYVIALGDQARSMCFTLVDSLRKEGFVVEQNFGDRSLKAAMKAADKSGARFAIVLGDSELQSGSVELKEMSSGALTSVRLTSLAKTLAEKSSGL